jgi:AcrR family transcriptional regulator
MNKPQQARSQQTYDKLLDAAANLLDAKSFEEMTISDIVAEAGCSVGAFYGRFKDKDALLHALDARYVDQQLAAGQDWVNQGSRPERTLNELILDLMNMLHQTIHRDPGLLRTLVLRARLYPDPRFREQEARLNAVVPEIIKILMTHHTEIKHPDPEMAIATGFLQAYLTMREALSWDHIGQNFPVSGKHLTEELARSFSAYLQYK